MEALAKLKKLRDFTGKRDTIGLADDVIAAFLKTAPKLKAAIDEAYEAHKNLHGVCREMVQLSEAELIRDLHDGIVNFYPLAATNPYVPLAAHGPWIVTTHGAVVHDSGGYGMLGLGHAPQNILKIMNENHVMANIMTASFSQRRLINRLRREIGHSTKGGKPPFANFLCMNSGSEAVTVAMRIADINAKRLTDPGGQYERREIRLLSLKGSFHGRTDRPAMASNSTAENYFKTLASFRDRQVLDIVKHNDIEDLRRVFAEAEKKNVFYECFLMEPVQGEGNPGAALSREFYDVARELTRKHKTMMIMDSIQAAIRAQGCLSVVDYPGFEDCDAPDMETYSKALNAGQYPLSVLAMRASIADLYVTGVYGNTMTSNPRALEVACTVLDSITPQLRRNICDRGAEFVQKLKKLQAEFPDDIADVQGTGLLFAAELNPKRFKVVGLSELEVFMRKNGIGVIHGGKNALRFTPHFEITSQEVDMIVDVLRKAMKEGPRH